MTLACPFLVKHYDKLDQQTDLVTIHCQRTRPDILSDIGLRKHMIEHPIFY